MHMNSRIYTYTYTDLPKSTQPQMRMHTRTLMRTYNEAAGERSKDTGLLVTISERGMTQERETAGRKDRE